MLHEQDSGNRKLFKWKYLKKAWFLLELIQEPTFVSCIVGNETVKYV